QRDVARIVLQVAVHRHHDAAPGGLESGVERGAETRVLLEADEANPWIGLGQSLHDVNAAVRRAVVDEDDLRGAGDASQHADKLFQEVREVVGLVVHGKDHREIDEVTCHGRCSGLATTTALPAKLVRSHTAQGRPVVSFTTRHQRSSATRWTGPPSGPPSWRNSSTSMGCRTARALRWE